MFVTFNTDSVTGMYVISTMMYVIVRIIVMTNCRTLIPQTIVELLDLITLSVSVSDSDG